ncbi:MAG: extradiol ring-cleavage dioxygenase [Betaproteobacteria bacterium]|nr:extradiol ring-cleavage dioxygenase [Betaproteobacteria bacterium]
MAEILGIGTTHAPPLVGPDEQMVGFFLKLASAPNADHRYRDRANWPAKMLAEFGADEGIAAARAHRARQLESFRRQRQMIDEFAPDVVVIFGDDQYENFKEDIIPPFCVFGLDEDFDSHPWAHGMNSGRQNVWGETSDWTLRLHGHRDAAKLLTTGLLERGVAMPYAYKTLHEPVLGHSFTNTILYLDYDRRGFPHPVIPFHVNCYGSSVMTSRGAFAHLFEDVRKDGPPDPPSPPPSLCMEVGAKLAQVAAASPYRVVLMATSSWSHSFLSSNTGYVIPDLDSDRVLFEAFRQGDYESWRRLGTAQLERAGQHEMLNWMVLAGAMAEIKRKPVVLDYIETYIFQATKCFVAFPPDGV